MVTAVSKSAVFMQAVSALESIFGVVLGFSESWFGHTASADFSLSICVDGVKVFESSAPSAAHAEPISQQMTKSRDVIFKAFKVSPYFYESQSE